MPSEFENALIEATKGQEYAYQKQRIIAERVLALSPEDAKTQIATLSPEMTAEAMKGVGEALQKRAKGAVFNNEDYVAAQRDFVNEHINPIWCLIIQSRNCVGSETAKIMNPVHERFAERLHHEVDLKSFFDVEAWQTLPQDGKEALLQHVLTIASETYGIQNAELKFYQDVDESHEHGKAIVWADGTEVALNTALNQLYHTDGKEALTTLIHETLHAWQGTLASQFADGKMSKDDPRYNMAMMFDANIPDMLRHNSTGSLYIDGNVHHPLYEENVIEWQARLRSEKVVNDLQRKLAEQRINSGEGMGRGMGRRDSKEAS